MTMMRKILAGGAGLAAIAAAAPAAAQYGYASPYGYSQYAYGGVSTGMAAQRCTAAVQNRLYNRTGVGGILGALFGANTYSTARVLNVTQVVPRGATVRVRGLATSGRYAYNSYGPYGMGAYGGLGYNMAQQADLSFRCDVDYRGYVRNVDINRRY
jgi:hypothetical protein